MAHLPHSDAFLSDLRALDLPFRPFALMPESGAGSCRAIRIQRAHLSAGTVPNGGILAAEVERGSATFETKEPYCVDRALGGAVDAVGPLDGSRFGGYLTGRLDIPQHRRGRVCSGRFSCS